MTKEDAGKVLTDAGWEFKGNDFYEKENYAVKVLDPEPVAVRLYHFYDSNGRASGSSKTISLDGEKNMGRFIRLAELKEFEL